ncbi:hypothetical protein MAPG_05749 [Magnaporthiopsis poae ATCC 64411]|uniref:Uncharacterized protein n=1 Tax=Magnaporthiopsis poae (strain ATCC 64411 / 73-15) TaxID=644358 RepID=A0A0C4E082_MAGP6|nr:hypothetical protein MAPG_05749 [Magnaporthiopsis poae ATCC 64411]
MDGYDHGNGWRKVTLPLFHYEHILNLGYNDFYIHFLINSHRSMLGFVEPGALHYSISNVKKGGERKKGAGTYINSGRVRFSLLGDSWFTNRSCTAKGAISCDAYMTRTHNHTQTNKYKQYRSQRAIHDAEGPPNRSPPVTSPGGSSATITRWVGYAYPNGRRVKLLVHDVVVVAAPKLPPSPTKRNLSAF